MFGGNLLNLGKEVLWVAMGKLSNCVNAGVLQQVRVNFADASHPCEIGPIGKFKNGARFHTESIGQVLAICGCTCRGQEIGGILKAGIFQLFGEFRGDAFEFGDVQCHGFLLVMSDCEVEIYSCIVQV